MDEDSCVSFKIGGIDCCISLNLTQYKKEKENLQSQKYISRYILGLDYKNKLKIITLQHKHYNLKGETLSYPAYIWCQIACTIV